MQSIRTAQEFAAVHEEYVTEWSLSKAEKWFEQDVENAPARWAGRASPLHSDAESDGSEDLDILESKTENAEPNGELLRVREKSQPGRMSLLLRRMPCVSLLTASAYSPKIKMIIVNFCHRKIILICTRVVASSLLKKDAQRNCNM